MKKHIIRTITLMALLSGLAFPALAETVSVGVNGMVCAFCAQGIDRSFRKVEGVNDVYVNLEKKAVVIWTEGDGTLADEKIKEVIKDAGYTTTGIERGNQSRDAIVQQLEG